MKQLFYVIVVYFSAIQIKRVRHALAAALTGDLVKIIGAIISSSLLYAAL